MNEPKGEETIFDIALRLAPEQRAAYLDQATGVDGPQRRRIEALLSAYGQADVFLEKPADGALLARSGSAEAVCVEHSRAAAQEGRSLSEEPGDMIGRYKLLQQIGEGGCGVVYMAEQEEPIRRRVALKVIKLGMDTKSVIARFDAERQALAMMDHPNIAQVLDAGSTETGRPYFVMELVRGVKITEYCDEVRLSTRQRLDLFVQVCQAIQHAHQKGVIHRDIKPSNILVTINDGLAVPKVIDFGIAKATSGQKLTDKTLFTAFEQFIGTPAYMSPEQAMMTSLDIDTRSDIYALGVLLYELLTGKTPFDGTALLAAGLDVMRRTICEEEPNRPSTRVSTLPSGELGTTAQRRGLDAPKLISQLRGDLDWIVMKALEKDRARRYDTANGLALDIQRHLRNEPVLARPPSAAYRFQKMAQRNRLAVLASGAIAGSLIVGLGIATWMFIMEKQASQRALASEKTARSEAARSEREASRAQLAEADAKEKLWSLYFAQAQAHRWSGKAGRRFEALEALKKAAQIRTSIELRNEAIACLALPDLHSTKKWDATLPEGDGVSFDADYKRYAVGDAKGNVSVRRLDDGQELCSLHGAAPPMIESLFSPDGHFLAGIFDHGVLNVWNLDRREVVLTFTNRPCRTYQFSPDSRLIAISFSGSKAKRPVTIYDLASGRAVSSFEQAALPFSVQFNPDGDMLAISSSESRQVDVREVATGRITQSLTHPNGVNRLAWHRDGLLLAAACMDAHIYLWDTSNRTQVVLSGHQGEVINLAFNHRGNLLCSQAWDGTMRLWDPADGKQLAVILSLGSSCKFSADDKLLAYQASPKKIGLLEVATANACLRLVGRKSQAASIFSVLSSDGKWLAASQSDGIRLWDVDAVKEITFLPESVITAVAFHPDGSQLFACTSAGLKAWPIHLTEGRHQITLGPPALINPSSGTGGLDLDSHGDLLAYTQWGGVRVLNFRAAKEIGNLRIANTYNTEVLSRDGRSAAAWDWLKGDVDVWDIATSKKIATVQAPTSAFCVFTPDNRWLVTGDQSEYRFWDTHDWQCHRRLTREGNPGRRGFMAVTGDGTVMAMAHSISTVRLIKTASGEELATLEAPELQVIHWLSLDADGSRLAVGCQPFGSVVWNLPQLRSELAEIGLDWDMPPYPRASKMHDGQMFKATVMTNIEAK